MKIIGENLYAKHAILYEKLPSYFIAFSVIDDNLCCSWMKQNPLVNILNTLYVLKMEILSASSFTASVLYRGIWDEDKVRACYTGKSVYGGEQEGFVVRLANEFQFRNITYLPPSSSVLIMFNLMKATGSASKLSLTNSSHSV